jgi:hypothetical protein
VVPLVPECTHPGGGATRDTNIPRALFSSWVLDVNKNPAFVPRMRDYDGESRVKRILRTSGWQLHFGPDEPDNQFFVPLISPRSPRCKKRFGRVLLSNAPVPLKLALRSPGKRRKATTAQPPISHTSSS